VSDHLFAQRLFVRIACEGRLSGRWPGSRDSPSTASRTIAQLECRIGVMFPVRNTRAVKLTDYSAGFLTRIEPVLAELDDAEDALRAPG